MKTKKYTTKTIIDGDDGSKIQIEPIEGTNITVWSVIDKE
jgi:hypothetical protein